MKGSMLGGAEHWEGTVQLAKGRRRRLEMLAAFDALPHGDFGNDLTFIARRVVGDIGPVDGDDRGAGEKRAEGNVPP